MIKLEDICTAKHLIFCWTLKPLVSNSVCKQLSINVHKSAWKSQKNVSYDSRTCLRNITFLAVLIHWNLSEHPWIHHEQRLVKVNFNDKPLNMSIHSSLSHKLTTKTSKSSVTVFVNNWLIKASFNYFKSADFILKA